LQVAYLKYYTPILGEIWTNSNTGLEMSFKKFNPMAVFNFLE